MQYRHKWVRSIRGKVRSTIGWGSTMVRNAPIKRQLGAVRAQLGVTACALLLPPLVTAAGVALFAYYPSGGARPKDEAQLPAAPESTIVKTVSVVLRSQGGRDFALADAERKPVQNSVVEQRVPARQRAPIEQRAPVNEASEELPVLEGRDPYGALDPAANYGPTAVTLVRISKAGAAPAMAALGPAPSIAPSIPRATPVFHRSKAPGHAFHAKGKIARHEPRNLHVAAKHQRPHAPTVTVRGRTRRG